MAILLSKYVSCHSSSRWDIITQHLLRTHTEGIETSRWSRGYRGTCPRGQDAAALTPWEVPKWCLKDKPFLSFPFFEMAPFLQQWVVSLQGCSVFVNLASCNFFLFASSPSFSTIVKEWEKNTSLPKSQESWKSQDMSPGTWNPFLTNVPSKIKKKWSKSH